MNNSKNLGFRVKDLRENRAISKTELAERCAISESLIDSIENGDALPSLAPLVRISRALGVRLGTFLDDAHELGPVISRKGEYAQGISFSSKSSGTHEHLNFFSLAAQKSGRHFEPFIVEIEPAQATKYQLSAHEGEEFIYVLDGSVEVIYGKETLTLNSGDSVYYDSVVDHHVHSANGSSARILVVLYAPF